jgi:hypothetical protein
VCLQSMYHHHGASATSGSFVKSLAQCIAFATGGLGKSLSIRAAAGDGLYLSTDGIDGNCQ